MTAPAPEQPQQPPPPPPPEQPEGGPTAADAALVAELAVLLASAGAAAAASGSAVLAAIVALLLRLPRRRGEPPVPRIAAVAVAKLVLQQPPVRQVAQVREAGRRMQRINIQRRAQYLIAAARRVTRSLGADQSREALVKALGRERRYWQQHLQASAKRTQAAAGVDAAADQHGKTVVDNRGRRRVLLSWRSVNDERTTAECRAANGKLFYADQPPKIGYPGTVHVHCRCRPASPGSAREFVDGGTLTS